MLRTRRTTREILTAAASQRKVTRERDARYQMTFLQFISEFYAGYEISKLPHVTRIAHILQDVADGKRQRLMILLPPKHFRKTILQAFIAYLEYREKDNDNREVIAYATWSAHAAQRVTSEAVTIAGTHVQARKRVLPMSIQSRICGWRFGTIIVNEPYRNWEEATDVRHQLDVEFMYDSCLSSRVDCLKKSSIIFGDSRWHKNDLAAHILNKESQHSWHVVHLPAICTGDFPLWLKKSSADYGTTLESDWRLPGDVLCSTHLSERDLAAIRERVGEYEWQTQWQLNPPAETS